MRFLAALSVIAFVSAKRPSAIPEHDRYIRQRPDHDLPQPEIQVVEASKAYVVKLDCVGCPFAVRGEYPKVEWQQPPQANALKLKFEIDTKHHEKPTLWLNGRDVLPLDPITPFITAWQVPANITKGDMRDLGYGNQPYGIHMPLQYEHTVLRTQEQGEIWVQFDITELALDELQDSRYVGFAGEPFKMDSEDQKLVQLRLHTKKETSELSIEEISVVKRVDRVQPYRMKCGRLAMVQTLYNPREWDTYGKYGTWERFQNMVEEKASEFWFDWLQHAIMFPLGMLFVGCVVLAYRRFEQMRAAREAAMADDAEFALLDSAYDDTYDVPPAYADLPIIKIEEYD